MTNGLGGYASGTVARRHDPPLPRPAHRRPARPARPHRDAQPSRRSSSALPRRRPCASSAARSASAAALAAGRRAPHRVPPGGGPAGLALRVRRRVLEKRVLLPHRQNTVHVTLPAARGRGPAAAQAAARRCTSARTRQPVGDRLRRRLQPAPPSTTASRFAVRRRYPPLRLLLHGDAARRSRSSRAECEQVLYRVEESRGYDARGELWSPGYFRVDLAPAGDGHARRLDRGLGDACTRCRRRRRSRAGARAAAAPDRPRPDPPRAPGSAAELVLAADQFIDHARGRVEDAARARAARRRGAHRHRRLPLVHRLGPRHDDQPRGADAGHRPAPRGGLHPAHVRATTSATA